MLLPTYSSLTCKKQASQQLKKKEIRREMAGPQCPKESARESAAGQCASKSQAMSAAWTASAAKTWDKWHLGVGLRKCSGQTH